jgi:hypothetical protein
MFSEAPFAAVYLIAFAIPALAQSRRQWRRYVLVALLPAVFFALVAVIAKFGPGFFGAVGFAAAAMIGALARRMSLMADLWGHPRPWSLWIEIVFAGLAMWFITIAQV